MGCKRCGNFHICCIKTCPITEIENNHVCTITGAVVRSITYDSTEYINTASQETSTPATNGGILFRKKAITASLTSVSTTSDPDSSSARADTSGGKRVRIYKNVSSIITKKHTVSRCINFHQRVCMRILCSDTTTSCYEKEQTKLRNRLRWSFMRHIRSCKLQRRDRAPNMIVMISKIAKDIENYRLPIMNDTLSLRQQLAHR